jgi:hypothetical protein
MNLIVRVPDELADRITSAGGDPEQLALAALRQAADDLAQASHPNAAAGRGEQARRAAAKGAGTRIRQNRIGNTLPPGVTIRELINYGRD